jgi:hypothetical protein
VLVVAGLTASAVPRLNPWHLLDSGRSHRPAATHSGYPSRPALRPVAGGTPAAPPSTRPATGAAPGAGAASRSARLAAGVTATGPWRCGTSYQWDPGHPALVEPCYAIGADVRLMGRMQAVPGVQADISLTLQDVATGQPVAGPYTCPNLRFSDSAPDQTCGPFHASVAHGRRYVVVQSWHYSGQTYVPGGTARGPEFTW